MPSSESLGTTYGIRGLDEWRRRQVSTIAKGAELRIKGGTVFAALAGEPDAAIQVGSWSGIWVKPGGRLDLSYAEISCGGYSRDAGGIACKDNVLLLGGTASLTHCTVSDQRATVLGSLTAVDSR